MTYLGSKEEPEVTATIQTVLDEKGNFLREAETDVARQGLGLAEVEEILDRESQGDGLGQVDGHVVL